MKSTDIFPSTYLKAADLKGREASVVIDRVVMEDKIEKPIIYFQVKEKGLVCNKTNWNRIAYLYGDESDDWTGQPVVLASELVDFQGKTVEAIRIRPPRNGASKPPGEAVAPNPKSPQITTMHRKVGGISDTQLHEDEVPF